MKTAIVLSLILALAIPCFAQQAQTEAPSPAPRGWSEANPPVWLAPEDHPPLLYQDETPEERMKRNGVTEDPGTDPEPGRIWVRGGQRFTIEQFPRPYAVYYNQPRGKVRPLRAVNSAADIYHENEEFVWVWLEAPDEKPEAIVAPTVREADGGDVDVEEAPDEAAAPDERAASQVDEAMYVEMNAKNRAYLESLKKEFALVVPPSADTVLRFEESSKGLPTSGSWRNGLDVADMNGDGLLDIVLPPQRGGAAFPTIYLGTPEGEWKPWHDARWPSAFNYGTVAAGDLNGDGKIDLVLGSHLLTVNALLGNGAGRFRMASEGLPERFATRRVVLVDVDGDGDLDIFALSEGATVGSGAERGSRLRLFLNDGSGERWQEIEVAETGRQVGGDWMTAGDFNGDGRVDVAGSSIFLSGPDLVYLQRQGGAWGPWGRGSLPFRSFYSALTAGDFTAARGEDLILSYRRVWPKDRIRPGDFENPIATSVVGLERVTWDRKGRPERSTIISWDRTKPVWGLAGGDFNGDGHRDLVYSLSIPRRLEFLLGDGKGGFRAAAASGIDLPNLTLYDLKVADVNRDGKDDILVMFEKSSRASDGSVRVFLGGGAARVSEEAPEK
ncbi:MAG: FG-GAP repeat domain-containing protein [Thermoanaerobaculia bacterium]